MPKSIARYNGGKTGMLSEILPVVPTHDTYIEVFGGAASVLLNKPRSPSEIYNDLNGDIVNLVTTIRDSKDELQSWLERTPPSRQIHSEIKEAWHSGELPENDIERAGWTFYLLQCSHGATLHERQGWRRDSPVKPNQSTARQYQNKVTSLSSTSDRLGTVCIENSDWSDIFRMYDHSDSFFYCDPPYRGTEGRVTDKPFSHTEFLETLPTLSGKWLLSYGELPSVFDTGEYDHRIIDREENAGDTAIREVLVANYDMSEASFSGMNQSALTAYVER